MQHGRRDGRDGLLQGCAEQKQYATSRQCPFVLFTELLAEWNDSSEGRPRPTKAAAISSGASGRCSGHSASDAAAEAQ